MSEAVETALPTTIPTVAATPSLESRWLSQARLEQAARFRKAHGLRDEAAWIRSVATDPEAVAGIPAFGVPMLPAEVNLLRQRAVTLDRVIESTEAYGESMPDVWAGAYIRPDIGTVVASFVGPTEAHEEALLASLDPGSPLVIREVAHSLRDLKALQRRISRDSWIADSGHHRLSVGTLLPENLVRVEISSADPQAADEIIQHYGGAGMMIVQSDGTGVAAWPQGAVRGKVVDAAGNGLAGLDIALRPDIEGAGPSEIGVSTRGDGTFDIPETTATGYTLEVLSPFGPGGQTLEGPDRIVVASIRVIVPAGETVDVVARVPNSP